MELNGVNESKVRMGIRQSKTEGKQRAIKRDGETYGENGVRINGERTEMTE